MRSRARSGLFSFSMATATMATAAGAAILLYYVLSRRLSGREREGEEEGGAGEDFSKLSRSGRRRLSRRPAQAPATWLEAIATLSETLRFTYSETLGKWPIGDLAFGIKYLMRQQVRCFFFGGDFRTLEFFNWMIFFFKLM